MLHPPGVAGPTTDPDHKQYHGCLSYWQLSIHAYLIHVYAAETAHIHAVMNVSAWSSPVTAASLCM
jgi:hypothetical protein